MTTIDKDKLADRIRDADIKWQSREDLLLRLKVASHEGVASIIREFEGAVAERRKQCLQSHRRFAEGLIPRNKMCLVYAFK